MVGAFHNNPGSEGQVEERAAHATGVLGPRGGDASAAASLRLSAPMLGGLGAGFRKTVPGTSSPRVVLTLVLGRCMLGIVAKFGKMPSQSCDILCGVEPFG